MTISTVEDLAAAVRAEFVKYIHDDGFRSFAEMRRSYDWEWTDVKIETNSIINELALAAYKNGEFCNFWLSDDLTFIQVDRDIYWKDFKKMVFANL